MLEEIFIFLIVLVITAIITEKLFVSSNRYPPGPFGLPILGYLPFLGSEPYKTLCHLKKKYGSIYSISLGTTPAVVFNKATHIREVGKKNEFSGRPDLDFNKLWSGGPGSKDSHGILFTEGEEWAEQRRFALRHLRDLGLGRSSMEDLILHEVQQFMDVLGKNMSEPIAVEQLFELSVVNALWTLVTGKSFQPDDKFMKNIVENVTRNITEANTTGIHYFFPRISKMFPRLLGWNLMESSVLDLRNFCLKEINDHKSVFDPNNPNDFINLYMKEMKNATDGKSSFYGKKGELSLVATVMDLFGAGVETTSSALSWSCLYLAHFPEVQKKVQKELDEVVGRHHTPTLANKEKLVYLQATIQEVIRFSGMVPFMLQHKTTEDVEFGGYLIPKNTLVMLNAYEASRDPDYWDNPEEFRPERFIGPDGTFQNNDAFILFGSGKRVCIGESLARTSLYLFLSALLQKFSLKFKPGSKPSLNPRSPGIVLHPDHFLLNLSLRDA